MNRVVDTVKRWAAGEARGSHTALTAVASTGFGAIALRSRLGVEHPCTLDDAFMALRYADNLASGNGLVFNVGERVWGFTSPLFVLLVSGLGALGVPIVTAALVLSALASAAAPVFVQRLFARELGAGGSMMVALLAIAGGTLFTFSGLETSLLLALQSLFLLCSSTGRARAAALVGALACLTRPDSIVLVGPVLLSDARTRTLRCLSWFAVPGLLWVGFAAAYYGALLPNSFHAKRGMEPFTDSWLRLTNHIATLPVEELGLTAWVSREAIGALPAFALNAAVTVLVLANAALRRRKAVVYALIVYPWVLVTSYALIGPPPGHVWEVHSAAYFNHLALIVAVVVVALGGIRRIHRRFGRLALVPALGLTGLAALVCVNGATGIVHAPFREQNEAYGGVRHRAYLQVAKWLVAHVPKSTSVGVNEPGTIGFFSGAKLLDQAGIVTRRPALSPELLLVPGEVDAIAVRRAFPEPAIYRRLVVFREPGFHPLTLMQSKSSAEP